MLNTEKIKELRKALKMTQADAAKKSGLGTKARWQHIETGVAANITLETLGCIADALEVEPESLLVKRIKRAKR